MTRKERFKAHSSLCVLLVVHKRDDTNGSDGCTGQSDFGGCGHFTEIVERSKDATGLTRGGWSDDAWHKGLETPINHQLFFLDLRNWRQTAAEMASFGAMVHIERSIADRVAVCAKFKGYPNPSRSKDSYLPPKSVVLSFYQRPRKRPRR